MYIICAGRMTNERKEKANVATDNWAEFHFTLTLFLGLFNALFHVDVFNVEKCVTELWNKLHKLLFMENFKWILHRNITVLRMYKSRQIICQERANVTARLNWACLSAIRASYMLRNVRLPAVCLKFISMTTDQSVWLQHWLSVVLW